MNIEEKLIEEIDKMEVKAQKYYKEADEELKKLNRIQSNHKRAVGNAIMENVVSLKKIIYEERE